MTIKCLHLSDLHLTSEDQQGDPVQGFNQHVVTTSMLSFIRDSMIKPDIVIITGDLAQKGKADEYQVAEVFCDKLLDVTGLECEQLFIVPGNHDVDRGEITSRHIKRLYPFDTQDEITEILKDPDDFPILMRKFSEFNTFAKQSMNRELFIESKFWFVESHHLKGYPVNLIGLNSCLFAGYDGDEKQKLALGMYQVEAAIQELDRESGKISNIGSLICTDIFLHQQEPSFMYNESKKMALVQI